MFNKDLRGKKRHKSLHRLKQKMGNSFNNMDAMYNEFVEAKSDKNEVTIV